MDKKIKARWVKALRSGKYKQGKHELKTADGRFCCLGVLCDLYAKSQRISFEKATESENEILPEKIQKWAGLNRSQGAEVEIKGEFADLTDHNDTYKRRFSTIAKAIEEQL